MAKTAINSNNSNSNSIDFKSLKYQWFSGPYMSNTHTQTQTFKHTQYMRENEENLN